MDSPRDRTYFLLIVLVLTAVLAFFVLRPFLTTLALAAVFAVVLHPLYLWLLKQLGGHRSFASLATMLVAVVCLLIPLSLLGTLIVNQSRDAYFSIVTGQSLSEARAVSNRIGSGLEPYIPGATAYADSISQEANTYAERWLQWLFQRLGTAFTSILAIALHTVIFLIALYYLLKDGAALERLLVKRSPLSDEEATMVSRQLGRTINSVVKGSLAIALIQGTLAGIGYTMFGLPNPALWGVCTSIAALIPGLGTSTVILPSVIYLFIVGNTWGAVGLLCWGLLLVGLIDNFLSPKLMGRGARLHPLVILLSVVGGVALFGPAGIFLGPLTISALFALYAVYAKTAPLHG